MNIRERLEQEVASKAKNYETAVQCAMMAVEDLQAVLDVDVPFYANVYAYTRGAQIYINDQGVTARFDKRRKGEWVQEDSRHNETLEELRKAVAAFNGFVSSVMDAAGVCELKKRVAGNTLKANVYLNGRERDGRKASHYFCFTWQGACEAKTYRVTKTEEITLCGELDASKYDCVEEIPASD